MHGGRELVYEPVETVERNQADGAVGAVKGRGHRQAAGRPETAPGARFAVGKGSVEEGSSAQQNSVTKKPYRKKSAR
jgi:hypothetical protein